MVQGKVGYILIWVAPPILPLARVLCIGLGCTTHPSPRILLYLVLGLFVSYIGLGCTAHPTPRILLYWFLGLSVYLVLWLVCVVVSSTNDFLCKRLGSFHCGGHFGLVLGSEG